MYIIKKLQDSLIGKQIELYKPVVLTTVFLSMLADIFFIPENSDVIIFGILIVYIFCILFFKLKSWLIFEAGIIVLLLMFFSLIINGTSVPTEKAAVWLFFIILIGIIQQIKE